MNASTLVGNKPADSWTSRDVKTFKTTHEYGTGGSQAFSPSRRRDRRKREWLGRRASPGDDAL
jgi:hypothetical protein